MLLGVKQTTVAAGATIDVAGFDTTIADLLGSGVVTTSGAPATLTLAGANFSGVISGALSLVANGAIILTGADTYTGTTTIQAGDSLQLGLGGATGSLAGGDISDAGTLATDGSGDLTLTNAVSGAGALHQIGTGVTSINTVNTYTGGTTLAAGTLAIGNGGALGTGALTVTNGELLGTASETLANALTFSTFGDSATFAAAPSTTLTLTGALTLAHAVVREAAAELVGVSDVSSNFVNNGTHLGDGRDQHERQRNGWPQSWAELACDRSLIRTL